jgi:hypothetical protein
LTINKIQKNEPIDMGLINSIIDRVNKLDSAGNLTVTSHNGTTKYTTANANLLVQAFTVIKSVTALDTFHGSAGTVTFGQAFAAAPVVTVTPVWSLYLVPAVFDITPTGFGLKVARSNEDGAIPTSVKFNVIAIGPIKAS